MLASGNKVLRLDGLKLLGKVAGLQGGLGPLDAARVQQISNAHKRFFASTRGDSHWQTRDALRVLRRFLLARLQL